MNTGDTIAHDEVSGNDGVLIDFTLDGDSSNWVNGSNVSGSYSATQTFDECQGFIVTVGANTYDATGIYSDTFATTNGGCDSIIVTDLNIRTVDNSTTVNGTTITANLPGASYVWMDCATSTSIPGETGASFTATANGSYAVVIVSDSCVDTSACVSILTIGINEVQQKEFAIFPNPVKDKIQVTAPQSNEPFTLSIVNAMGTVVKNTEEFTGSATVDISHVTQGLYYILIQSEGTLRRERIVKQ